MPFDAEELARTALVRLIPRGRYRIAAPNDAPIKDFAPNCVRVAYRQQGAQPAFLLFLGPDQDPKAAALVAADWAAANWRPNAVQKRVQPGVVVIQVGPAPNLAPAGAVAGAATPAAIWSVDGESGRLTAPSRVPGAPATGEIKRAASALAGGLPAASLGELDYAEREIMHPRSAGMPTVLTGGLAILLILFAVRYGFSSLFQVLLFMSLIGGGGGVNPLVALAGLLVNLLLVAGIVLGVALLVNFRGIAFTAPGFASGRQQTRTATWIGFGAAMALLAGGSSYALPHLLRTSQQNNGAVVAHVTAVAADDGSDVEVADGGDLKVDLRTWPANEWAGVRFTTSNPSVLSISTLPGQSDPPIATFDADAVGTCRLGAMLADGRYSFELRVSVLKT